MLDIPNYGSKSFPIPFTLVLKVEHSFNNIITVEVTRRPIRKPVIWANWRFETKLNHLASLIVMSHGSDTYFQHQDGTVFLRCNGPVRSNIISLINDDSNACSYGLTLLNLTNSLHLTSVNVHRTQQVRKQDEQPYFFRMSSDQDIRCWAVPVS